MTILLRSAKVTDPNSPFNSKTVDILIESGMIRSIRTKITPPAGAIVIEEKNLHVSPGWFDMQVNFRDPGFEYKEDLLSGCKAAAAGGFTSVAVMPSTHPPVHTKAEVEYIRKKTAQEAVTVYPVGTVSHRLEGKELSEMYDMHTAGAVAFSDDKHSISDAGLLLRALLYAKNFGGLVMTHCDEKSISMDGKMNEGPVSTSLGLKAMPALAEEVMLARNVFLAEYCNAPIHISSVSTKGSVELVREAKRKGVKITCSVNAHHLALGDSSLDDFDTNFKVNPPLRTKADTAALVRGLEDGTIDCIASDHSPEDVENKMIEFDHAAFGMTGLETAFALANMHKGKLSLQKLIEKIAVNPRKVLKLPVPKIKEREPASLTLFDPGRSWTLSEKDILSRSKNTPFIGKRLLGKALGIINKGTLVRA